MISQDAFIFPMYINTYNQSDNYGFLQFTIVYLDNISFKKIVLLQ